MARGNVNEAWYNTLIGPCSKDTTSWTQKQQAGFKEFLNSNGYCTLSPALDKVKDIAELTPELQEKVFFDQITIDQSQRNQCLADYWEAMSTASSNKAEELAQYNKTLLQDHPSLKGKLPLKKNISISTQKLTQAKEAQKKIVHTMIAVANKIAQKRVEMRDLPVSLENVPKRKQILNEIAILESSVPMAEDNDAKSFFTDEIYTKVYNKVFFGQPIDLNALEDKAIDDSKNSFQEKVVTPKLNQLTKAQKELADMHGNYHDQHSFKVASFEKGYAEDLLFNLGSTGTNRPYFSKLNCSLQSKYGIGSEISTLSNGLILGGATIAVGGAGLAMAKLTRAGFVGTRTYEVFNTTANITNGTITSTDLAVAMVQGCFDSNAGNHNFSSCTKSKRIETEGIVEVVDNDLTSNQCLINIATSALSGGVGLKQAALAQKISREKDLLKNALKVKRDQIFEGLDTNDAVQNSLKQQIKTQVDKTMSLVATDGIPNASVLSAVSKEDPEGLLQMLTEINSGAQETWAQKARTWFKSKSLTKEESAEMEFACWILFKNNLGPK